MTQTVYQNTIQIVALTPVPTVTDLSFLIRSPEFSEGVRKGQDCYQEPFNNREVFASDVDFLRFLTNDLTPFSPHAASHAGKIFGWLHLFSVSVGRDSMRFHLPVFEHALMLGETDYQERSLEELDCDTELICFLAQKLSPQFDQDLTATCGEFPLGLQQIAGYICGVVLAVLREMSAIEERLPSFLTNHAQLLSQKQHLFPSLLPAILDSNALDKALGVDFQQCDEFSQGYLNGSDQAYSDRIEGHLLSTEQELWAFLSQECAPKVLDRERKLDLLHGLTPTPLGYRTGFLTGYLHTMYALQLAEEGHTHD